MKIATLPPMIYGTAWKEEATAELVKKIIGEEKFDGGRFKDAANIFERMSTRRDCPEFLTLEAYDYLE